MADNLTTTTTVSTVPSGTVISTDDAGASGHVQRVKLALSADGSAAHATVDADGVLVNLGTNNDVTLATLPDTAAGDLAAINSAVGGTLTVNLGANNDVTVTSGTVTANLSATDNAVLDAIAAAQLPDGHNVTVDNASIAVTAASLPLPTGASTAANQSTANTSLSNIEAGIAAEGAALGSGVLLQGDDGTDRKNINVDATTGDVQVDVTNTVTVDGSGVTQPVSGTITANLGATDNAVLDAIAAAQLPDGHNVTVDNASIAITHAALTELAAAINTSELDVNIATDSVGIGGGTQYTEDAAAAANPTGTVPIMVRADSPAGAVTTDGDNIAQRATNYGAGYVQVVDSSGNFVDTFGGSGGTAAADDADFVAGTTQGTLVQGVYESSPTSVTDGDMGAVGITQTRSMKVEETNSAAILADTASMDTNLGTVAGAVSGSEMQVDIVADGAGLATAANQLPDGHAVTVDNASIAVTNAGLTELAAAINVSSQMDVNLAASAATVIVDGSGVTQPVSGTVTSNLSATDNAVLDAIAASTAAIDSGQLPDGHNVTIDNGAAGAAVNIQDGGNSITIDGTVTANLGATDNAVLDAIVTATEATQAAVEGTLTVGSHAVTNAGTFATQAAAAGDIAHDAADSGNPVKVGGKAVNVDGTTPGTAVAEGDRANFITDVYGRQLVSNVHPNYWHVSADYAGAQTNATVKAAPGAGLKLYVTDIVISNGSTAGNITLLDGSGGTVLIEIYPAINGGMSTNLRTPIALTANTLLAITSTTVVTHSVFVSGYTAP